MSTTNLTDIDTCKSVPQLREFIERAKARITELQNSARDEFIQAATEAALELGYENLESLLSTRRQKRGRKPGRARTNGVTQHHNE